MTRPSRDVLLNAVERLGGFPVAVSTTGAPLGPGVLVARNDADLVALVRNFAGAGRQCLLFAVLPAGSLWRATVVDDEVLVAAHGPWDGHPATVPFFDAPEAYATPAPVAVQQLAVRAVAAMGLRAGTVDLLDTKAHVTHVLDVVFPPELLVAQEVTGIDLAARVVAALCPRQG